MTPQALESCSLPSYGNASAAFAAVPDMWGHLSGRSLQPDSWLVSALAELSTPVCRCHPLLPRGSWLVCGFTRVGKAGAMPARV